MLAALLGNIPRTGFDLGADEALLRRLADLYARKNRRMDFDSERAREQVLYQQVVNAYRKIAERPEVQAELAQAVEPEQKEQMFRVEQRKPLDFESLLQNQRAIEILLERYVAALDEEDVEILLLMDL